MTTPAAGGGGGAPPNPAEPGAAGSAPGTGGAEPAPDANSAPADTGAGGGGEWEAKFKDLQKRADADKAERIALTATVNDMKAGLAGMAGVAAPSGDDDPGVALKKLQDDLATEQAARQTLEKSLTREKILRGVVDTKKAAITVAGLEATGAIDLSTSDPLAIKKIADELKADYPELFTSADAPPPRERTNPRIPAPAGGGGDDGPKFAPSILQGERRVI